MNILRHKKFTSSENYKLIPFGKRKMNDSELEVYKKENPKSKALLTTDKSMFSEGGYTYIKQTIKEGRLGKSLDGNSGGKPTIWGTFIEYWLMHEASDLIGLEYILTPSLTSVHPNYPTIWAGSKDGMNTNTGAIIDLKCPYTLESFTEFAELYRWYLDGHDFKTLMCEGIMSDNGLSYFHKDGEKYYWQLVSNACIDLTDLIELIIFCPDENQLDNIVRYAVNGNHGMETKVGFIQYAIEDDLPCVPNACEYPNMLKFKYQVPQVDLDLMENRIVNASKFLIDGN